MSFNGDILFEKSDPSCENDDMGKIKKKLIDFFDKTDRLFQNDYFKKVFREKAGGNDEFFGNLQHVIYELMYHHFCEMVILNNTYSDNEIEVFKEMVIRYTKFKQKDWIKSLQENNIPICQFKMSRNDLDLKLVCDGIVKKPQYHMKLIDNTGEINYYLSHMLNLFAVVSVYDKTCDFIDLANLYVDILKGFIRVCPDASEKAVAFIAGIVNVIKIRFNGHYSFMLENDFGPFVPTEEQKQIKALMDFSVSVLEKCSKETAELALKLKVGYMIFGCFLVEKMTEMSAERYQILKYFFRDCFIEFFHAREFHAVNILDYFEDYSNKLTDFYDNWPGFFNIFKKLDSITVESAGAPFSKVVHLVFAHIQRHVVSAERMLSDKKVNDSIRFLNKVNEITGVI